MYMYICVQLCIFPAIWYKCRSESSVRTCKIWKANKNLLFEHKRWNGFIYSISMQEILIIISVMWYALKVRLFNGWFVYMICCVSTPSWVPLNAILIAIVAANPRWKLNLAIGRFPQSISSWKISQVHFLVVSNSNMVLMFENVW